MSRVLEEAAPPPVAWRKSSYSVDDSHCVELAPLPHGTVAVRDSKAPEHGTLALPAERFAELRRRIREGDLDLRP
ncbi:DUF397 domain-containing protein [Actinomadura sp. B10D3]|uniref:DUF397 domain-containing protein n=1 Tax=Actinomadura sp. B10D3 TaxID=3153557 RepID=UPI00325ECEA6